ncbi:MAG: serine hydroxymethyltransferase, partial [Actinobacteria bacterium]|nr:serine hydroxymethyltransferase [Actinomycetota bacterium]
GFTIVSGGTDDHLFLLSLVGRDITGKEADEVLGRAYITVNKNAVPDDPRPPFVTSGIRIGTPAVTRRGFGLQEVTDLTHWICDILEDHHNESLVAEVKSRVLALCQRFPVYG